MGATKRIFLSFAIAVVMLGVSVVQVWRGAPVGIRLLTATAIGAGYAIALVLWRARGARR